jgi:murein DD-endopeptidase MepM/ murein hydrolase activator NlpD
VAVVKELKIPEHFAKATKKFVDQVNKSLDNAQKIQKAAQNNVIKFPQLSTGPIGKMQQFERNLTGLETRLLRGVHHLSRELGPAGRSMLTRITSMLPGEMRRWDVNPLIKIVGMGGIRPLPFMGPMTIVSVSKWLWDKSIELMDAINNDNMRAVSMGTTIGGLRAFRLGTQLLDTNQLQQSVFQATGNIIGRESRILSLIGANAVNITAMDTTTKLLTTLTVLQQWVQRQQRGTELTAAHAIGLDERVSPALIMQLRNMSPEELREIARWVVANRAGMEPSQDVIDNTRSITKTIMRLGVLLESEFLNKLSGAAESLTPFLEWITKWLTPKEDPDKNKLKLSEHDARDADYVNSVSNAISALHDLTNAATALKNAHLGRRHFGRRLGLPRPSVTPRTRAPMAPPSGGAAAPAAPISPVTPTTPAPYGLPKGTFKDPAPDWRNKPPQPAAHPGHRGFGRHIGQRPTSRPVQPRTATPKGPARPTQPPAGTTAPATPAAPVRPLQPGVQPPAPAAPMGPAGRTTASPTEGYFDPASGRIVSRMGDPRGGGRSHQGVDIAQPYGSPIYSVGNGVVVRHNPHGSFQGDAVTTIQLDNGRFVRYMHHSLDPNLKVGDRVSGGQQIGTSGRANGVDHLHFDIWTGNPRVRGSRLVDPEVEFGWDRRHQPGGGPTAGVPGARPVGPRGPSDIPKFGKPAIVHGAPYLRPAEAPATHPPTSAPPTSAPSSTATPRTAPTDRTADTNWNNYLDSLAFKESSYRTGATTGTNRGAFQQNENDVNEARRLGVRNWRNINTGSYTDQRAANRDYIERRFPGAASAIARGDYDAADRGLNKHWVSLPGGSQAGQNAARLRQFDQIRQGRGPRPPGEDGVQPDTRTAQPGRNTPSDMPTFRPPSVVHGNQPAPTPVPTAGTSSAPATNAKEWHDLPKYKDASAYNMNHVDPRLRESIWAGKEQFEANHPGYTVQGYSGRREVGAGAGPHWSDKGAIDVVIVDKNGKMVPNKGSDPSGLYHEYARHVYGELSARYPELKDKFAWGGAFGTKKGGGGPPDLMHFDLQGRRGHWAFNQPQNMGGMPGVTYGKGVTLATAGQKPTVTPPEKVAFGQPVQTFGQKEDKHPVDNMKVNNHTSFFDTDVHTQPIMELGARTAEGPYPGDPNVEPVQYGTGVKGTYGVTFINKETGKPIVRYNPEHESPGTQQFNQNVHHEGGHAGVLALRGTPEYYAAQDRAANTLGIEKSSGLSGKPSGGLPKDFEELREMVADIDYLHSMPPVMKRTREWQKEMYEAHKYKDEAIDTIGTETHMPPDVVEKAATTYNKDLNEAAQKKLNEGKARTTMSKEGLDYTTRYSGLSKHPSVDTTKKTEEPAKKMEEKQEKAKHSKDETVSSDVTETSPM